MSQDIPGLQQQYKECQELLGLYQQYLSQQQQKLNQSIAELHSKVSASEAGPRGPSGGSPPDGAHPGPDRGSEGRPRPRRRDGGGPRAARTPSDPTDPSSSSGEGGPAQPRSKHRSARRGGENRSAASTGPRRGPADRSRPTDGEAEGRAALTDPLLGHEDWEEKRHQLLLQKLQLEAERERLRARLAEQERRLARQGQQLRQSRLDYSRLQHATLAETAHSVTGSGASPSERPSNRRLFFGECEDAEAAEHLWSREPPPPQTSAGALQTELSAREALRCSRQDAATSPVTALASAPEPRPVSPAALPPKTPEARSESSLLQLLGVASPVSLPLRRQSSLQLLNATAPRAALKQCTAGPAASYSYSSSRGEAPRASLSSCSSGRFTQNPQQDLEESQILEDIFFIC